jgi:TonB-linked SusC/RagA family outer membrane protein
MSNLRRLLAVLIAVAAIPVGVDAQQTGTITGRVTDPAAQPLAGVTVQVQGAAPRAVTDAQGNYRIQGVPAGRQTVTAALIGRTGASQAVTVAAGQTATANFTLASEAVALEGLVVTATGQTQRRREVGNSVSNVNVARDVPLAATPNLASVLNGRSAGVTVLQSGGTTGTGARVRIRGSNSVSLSNEPLLIVDGVRINNNPNSNSIGVGNQSPSRLNDINPEDIENIEILKGPAAAALYGTAAANGVIQITTKRGRAGKTQWNAYAEGGTIQERTNYPANFAQIGRTTAGARTTNCNIDSQARGLCTPVADSLVSFNPLEEVSPFRDGSRQKYGLGVQGGGEAATYYLSGDFENEKGIYEVSELQRVNLRANISGQLRENLDVTVNTGYLNSDLSLPQNDNNILGLVSGGLLGSAFDNPTTRGYIILQPSDIFAIDTRQEIDRFTSGATARWQPLSWLNFTSQTGLDLLNRFDNETVPPERVFFGSLPEGSRTSNRFRIANYTANVAGTGTFSPRESVVSTTTAGLQFSREEARGTTAFGAKLLAGTATLSGTNARFSVGESFLDNRTIGGLVSQQFAFVDRYFITGTIRADDNNAFGQDFGIAYYPALSASWVIGEESWFPQVFSNFRLRAAYGQSGLRPGFRDAFEFFSPVAVSVAGNDVPGFTAGGLGNVSLRPERSTEYEAGFDAGILENRIGLEVTAYQKTSRDALIARNTAPSLGVAATRFENIGSVRNQGVEGRLNADLFDTDRARLDVTFTGTTTRNELLELGEGISPIIFGLTGNSQRHSPGYPLGGYWARPFVSFADNNGDGLISRVNCPGGPALAGGPQCEVVLGDTAEYRGTPFPTRELSFQTNATLFNVVKLSTLFDYKGGHKLFNSTEEFRCSSFFTCETVQNRNSPLAEQARFAARLLGTLDGYFEDADFVKWREAAVTFMVPESFNQRLGVRGLGLTLAGRNLKTWTDYSGFDPELNGAGQANFSSFDFLTQPPVRYFTARVNFNF